MSPLPARDPRETPVLELPVPGDEDPPDHVTYHGELADRLDIAVPEKIRLPLDAAPPPNVSIGDEIILARDDPATIPNLYAPGYWRLRRRASDWLCVGGTPYVLRRAGLQGGSVAVNTWYTFQPTITIGVGIFRIRFSMNFILQSANEAQARFGASDTFPRIVRSGAAGTASQSAFAVQTTTGAAALAVWAYSGQNTTMYLEDVTIEIQPITIPIAE